MNALVAHFGMMATYNRRANEILYAAVADLPEAERKMTRPAYFGSIHGTLNHILLGDRIWLGRFEGQEMPSTGLDTVLYEDFDGLWGARQAEDARLDAFVSSLDDDFLAGRIAYVNNQGRALEDPVATLLAHLFNHQIHHRGQVHDMLSQTAIAPPSLDLHRVINP